MKIWRVEVDDTTVIELNLDTNTFISELVGVRNCVQLTPASIDDLRRLLCEKRTLGVLGTRSPRGGMR